MRTIALVGLGYVGLGLAVALSKKNRVIGYDISESRIEALKKNIDTNALITEKELSESPVEYTSILDDIKKANFYIVAVSTPAFYFELPNLQPLIKATQSLATVLKKGDVVVFESTVYPGTTEEVCVPVLEKISQLKSGVDFDVGYSPERISPGDEAHTLKNVTKIISADSDRALKEVREIYESCCDTVYPVSNIKTAEAVKILENTQRDINIAIMNEFSSIMHALDLNVHEIIEAAKTKWSFVPFKPGFVGGHCISVDPLYLAFKAKRLGVDHDLILAARKVNDNMTRFVVQEMVRLIVKSRTNLTNSKIGIFGVTYKEDVPDVRNSLALKLVKELKMAGYHCKVHDPMADRKKLKKNYDIDLVDFSDMNDLSIAIMVVAHSEYKTKGFNGIVDKLVDKKILMDIPNLFVDDDHQVNKILYWCL